MTKYWNKGMRVFFGYIIVGGLNFITSLGLFYLMSSILGVNYLITFTVTWIYGVTFSYIANFIFVFHRGTIFELNRKFAKYLLIYISSYVLNFFALRYFVENYKYDPFFTQIALMPLIVAYNFSLLKNWGFK